MPIPTTQFQLDVSCRVVIDIKDRAGVIDRYLEGGEFHGQHPYGCTTEREIIDHLAFNVVSNNVTDITQLDGWADLESDAAVMYVDRNSMDIDHG